MPQSDLKMVMHQHPRNPMFLVKRQYLVQLKTGEFAAAEFDPEIDGHSLQGPNGQIELTDIEWLGILPKKLHPENGL